MLQHYTQIQKARKQALRELPALLKYNAERFQILEQNLTNAKLVSCSKKTNHRCNIKPDPKSTSQNVVVIDRHKFLEGKIPNVIDGDVKSVTYNVFKQRRSFIFGQADYIICTVQWFQCGMYFFAKSIFQLFMTSLLESHVKTPGRVRTKLILDHKIALRSIVNDYNQGITVKIKCTDREIREQIDSVIPRVETFYKIGYFMFYEVSWECWKESRKLAIKMKTSGFSLDHTFDVTKNIYGKYQTLKQPTVNFDKLSILQVSVFGASKCSRKCLNDFLF